MARRNRLAMQCGGSSPIDVPQLLQNAQRVGGPLRTMAAVAHWGCDRKGRTKQLHNSPSTKIAVICARRAVHKSIIHLCKRWHSVVHIATCMPVIYHKTNWNLSASEEIKRYSESCRDLLLEILNSILIPELMYFAFLSC